MARTSFGLDTCRVERRPVRDGEAVTLSLSFPPSVNSMFVNVPGEGRALSKQYREWRTENGWRINAARSPRVPGAVKVTLEMEDKAGRRDLDNLCKPCLDILVTHHIIDGDHRTIVREIAMRWASVKGCRVTIEPYRESDNAPESARRAA